MRWGGLVCTLFVLCLMSGSAHGQDILRPAGTITYPEDSAVGISPDASRILVIEPDGKTTIYNSYGSLLLTTKFEGEPIFMPSARWRRPIAWSPDNTQALFFSYNTLYWLDATSGTIQEVASFPDQTITKAGFFEDTYLIASAGRDTGSSLADQQMIVWDKATFEEMLRLTPSDSCLLELPSDPFEARLVRLMREQRYFVCYPRIEWNADQTQYLRWSFWNSSPPASIDVYETGNDEPLLQLRHCAVMSDETPCRLAELGAVAWSSDESRIVSIPGYGEEHISIWDALTGDLLYSLPPVTREGEWKQPDGLRIRNDGQQVMVIANTGTVFMWDMTSGVLLHEWQHDESVITGAEWIYGNSLVIQWGEITPWSLAAGVIWDANTGEKLALIASPKAALNQVVEDQSKGLLLLVWSTQIEIFDLATLAEVWQINPGR